MRPRKFTSRWIAATICALATSGFVAAEEGIVSISATDGNAGIVRMSAATEGSVPHASLDSPAAFDGFLQQTGNTPSAEFTSVSPYQNAAWTQSNPLAESPFQFAGFSSGQCCNSAPGCAPSDRCEQDCNVSGCNMCDGNGCYGTGYCDRVTCLFAGAVPQNSCNSECWAKRWWRGQYVNYHGRNQRLANHLFGWMVPSGCCGQGCPPCGKYQVTYADNPGYADHRDNGQAYGAQGYGMPLSVPLAPTVRQAYNYSWGTPSSRITPMGNYTPQTSVRPLYHQTW